MTALQLEVDGTAFVFSGTLRSPDMAPTGVVVYTDPMPTGINRDYDARSWCSRVDAKGNFRLVVREARQGELAFNMDVYHRNGAKNSYRLHYVVPDDGSLSVADLRGQLAMARVRSACDVRNAPLLREAVRELATHDASLRRRARPYEQWMQTLEKQVALGDVPAAVTNQSLAQVHWDTASVGWMKPCANMLFTDNGELIAMRSTRRVFSYGLYAHAPATYTYRLNGKWKQLRATAALQLRHPGSVVFVVKGDGRELFRSGMARVHREALIDVDISGVEHLKLITETGPDGPSGDWGIWGDPRLLR